MHDLLLFLFNHGFKFHNSVCNGCHDLTMLTSNISDIATTAIINIDYCCTIPNIRSAAINFLIILFLKIANIYEKD